MKARILLALSVAAALALPARAQQIFSIIVQENGQAINVANGGNIGLNAPAVGQNVMATVQVTYLGTATAVFASSGQLLGSTAFSATGDGPVTLGPGQATIFNLNYLPASSAQATADFLWPFTEVQNVTTTTTGNNGTTTTTTTPQTVGSGAISFNLIGTAPNLVVGQLTATGSFQIVPSGGTIQFPNTAVNATSSITVAVSNTGSGPGIINSIATTGAGYILGGLPVLPITINPGNQLNFTVQFQPSVQGIAPGSLQISFANGNYSAVLSGTSLTSFLSYTETQGGTTSSLTPGQAVTFSPTNVGTPTSTVVQFTNVGAAAVTLSTVAVSGAGFSFIDGPFLPLILQPQQTNSVTIQYVPGQPGPASGRLQIGNDSFTLSASGLGSVLTLSYSVGGTSVPISAGGSISFPTVAEGQTSSVQFTITNTGTSVASVASLGIVDPTGTFTLSNTPALPLQLNPAASTSFTINFSPVSEGVLTATLGINNQAIGLTGFSTAPPPLPAYQFTGASGTQQPFAQPAIGLSLKTPYALPLNGTLTITIISASFTADPAVQFASGGQKVAFTIPANTLMAVFPNGATQIQLQTGTVAGSIQITPDFVTAGGTDITPANPQTVQITVPAQAPTLLTAFISAQTNVGFAVTVNGYSPTRTLQNLTFQLTPASGSTLSATTITVDVSAAATVFFASAASEGAGGQFSIAVPFTLTQSGSSATSVLTTSITAISVKATNSVGASNVLQVPLP